MQTVQILDETIVHFGEGRLMLKTKPSAKRLKHWATRGILSRRIGRRVFLDFCYDGGSPCTSLEAYDRFQRAVNEEAP